MYSLSLSLYMHRVVYDQLFSSLIFVDKKKQTLCFLATLQLFQTWFKHLVASRRRGDTYYLQNTLLHREAAGWSAKGCDISSGKYMKAQDTTTAKTWTVLNGYFQQMIGSFYQKSSSRCDCEERETGRPRPVGRFGKQCGYKVHLHAALPSIDCILLESKICSLLFPSEGSWVIVIFFPSFSLFSQSFFLRLYSESDWCGSGWILRRCLNCMQDSCTINTLQYQPIDQKQKLSGHLTILGHPTKHFFWHHRVLSEDA